ncbi:MAG: hypothetical protein LBI82_02830 [Dysgonamonadaceae bacterium]|nr:hypothetical protein [Dysgonamonadaceae bacterium]
MMTIGAFFCNSVKAQTQVLVIGTIHQSHESNPNYSYQDLVNILETGIPNFTRIKS